MTDPKYPDLHVQLSGRDGNEQSLLRRRIATLETLQAARVRAVAQQKIDLDRKVEEAQRHIDNLRAQVTIQ